MPNLVYARTIHTYIHTWPSGVVVTSQTTININGAEVVSSILDKMCVSVLSSHSFWTSMDVPAGVTQEEGNTGFSIHLLSAVLA